MCFPRLSKLLKRYCKTLAYCFNEYTKDFLKKHSQALQLPQGDQTGKADTTELGYVT